MESRGESRPTGKETKLALTLLKDRNDGVVGVDFPYFGGLATEHFVKTDHADSS